MPQVPVQTGQYNRRVTIVSRSSSTNAMNEQIFAWTDGPCVWAKITQLFGATNYQTQQMVSKATSSITVRWNKALAGVDVADRVRFIDPTTGTVTLYEIETVGQINMTNRELYMEVYVLNGSV